MINRQSKRLAKKRQLQSNSSKDTVSASPKVTQGTTLQSQYGIRNCFVRLTRIKQIKEKRSLKRKREAINLGENTGLIEDKVFSLIFFSYQ